MGVFRGVRVDPKDRVSTHCGTINEYLNDTFNTPVKVVVRKRDGNHPDVEVRELQSGEAGMPVVFLACGRRGEAAARCYASAT